MKKIICILVASFLMNIANAAVWTPYVDIVSIKSPLSSDNLYLLSSSAIGISGCENARWLYLKVDTTLGITASRIKAAQALAMSAQVNGQKVRAYGTCFNASYFQVQSIKVK